MVGYASLILLSVLYNSYLKNKEITVMVMLACAVNFIGSAFTIMFCTKHYLGLPPVVFVVLTSAVTDTLYGSFVQLSFMALYAKLIPVKIEASLFAFLTGLSNLNVLFISSNIGILINIWVRVSYQDPNTLEKTSELYAVQAGSSLIPLLFLWLVPTKSEVAKV